MTTHCAECGEEGGVVSLKTCKSCKLVKYCSASCQRNHWAKHKKECKQRAEELRDEALFKDPPAKEDCPICFLPKTIELLSCVSLPPATIPSVPIYDFVNDHRGLADEAMDAYYSCCGKSICRGCIGSFRESGNIGSCPFCKAGRKRISDEERVEEMMKRVEVNDAGAICALGSCYLHGQVGLLQDEEKAKELWTQAADLGSNQAHYNLGNHFDDGGDLKKAKFHLEAAAMAGHEAARYNLGCIEAEAQNIDRAVKHWMIAASAGHYKAMHTLIKQFERGYVSRDPIDSTLTHTIIRVLR